MSEFYLFVINFNQFIKFLYICVLKILTYKQYLKD